MQVISSKDNEIVKYIRKLREKKYRDINNEYVIEGIKTVNEAIQEGAKIKKIVICEECAQEGMLNQKFLYEISKYSFISVTKNVFDSITNVMHPQGILAVIEKNDSEININYKDDIIVILDDIQDPGNLGTILRTLDSANISQLIISKETADVFNPKVVRSTMGAIFRVNVITSENLVDTVKNIKKHGYEICATVLKENSESIYDVNYKKKAIIIGNEANGVSKEILNLADRNIMIPMLGRTESLNASVATSIVVYEYIRQKLNGDIN